MLEKLKEIIEGKSICILGFGREGQSSYHAIRKVSEDAVITIADRDASLLFNLPFLNDDLNINFHGGEDYLSILPSYDLIFKTPGITVRQIDNPEIADKITSQSEIFIDYYREQIIGVTGTKGKSTTSSLIHHILINSGRNSVLVGNIGLPPFEIIDDITDDTKIVFELSSHQLETLKVSPHIAIILNLFEEHLDHYDTYDAYKTAKLNIAKYQGKKDLLITYQGNPDVCKAVQGISRNGMIYSVCIQDKPRCNAFVSGKFLKLRLGEDLTEFEIVDSIKIKGEHNLINCLVAALAAKYIGLENQDIIDGLTSFEGLRHRLEFVGEYSGVSFYNDSIATIPQATMEAIKTIGNVEFLILGGYDREVDYNYLVGFLSKIRLKNILCIGKAGERIFNMLKQLNSSSTIRMFNTYEDIFEFIKTNAVEGDTCLLSPSAASYDMFSDFEERGNKFTELARAMED